MALFKNKYRIETARLSGWDYRSIGYYFITIVIKNRIQCLSTIVDGNVELSPIGNIINEEWLIIPTVFPHVECDEFIIMPDHIHGIIHIHSNNTEQESCKATISNKSSNRSGSLSVIVNRFKGTCTKRIKKEYDVTSFAWQSRFYDRIIRNAHELYNVRKYIRENPIKWNQ